MEPEANKVTTDGGGVNVSDIIDDSLPMEETNPEESSDTCTVGFKRSNSRIGVKETLTDPAEHFGLIGVKRSNSAGQSEVQPLNKRNRPLPDIKGTYEVPEAYRRAASKAPEHVFDHEPDKDDVAFMIRALEVSKKSPDKSTQVGAIVVDPVNKKVLGEGWNRMPEDCEDRFPWDKGPNIEQTKYYYVLHGVTAAILDALKNTSWASLNGATVYSTLIPDNKDSQLIREVRIKRVVFKEDSNPDTGFTFASKKILEGLDLRQIKMPDEPKRSTSDSD